jgi:hypothetical protein
MNNLKNYNMETLTNPLPAHRQSGKNENITIYYGLSPILCGCISVI